MSNFQNSDRETKTYLIHLKFSIQKAQIEQQIEYLWIFVKGIFYSATYYVHYVHMDCSLIWKQFN